MIAISRQRAEISKRVEHLFGGEHDFKKAFAIFLSGWARSGCLTGACVDRAGLASGVIRSIYADTNSAVLEMNASGRCEERYTIFLGPIPTSRNLLYP